MPCLFDELKSGLSGLPLPKAADQARLFSDKKRKAWGRAENHVEARCDFAFKPKLSKRADVWFASIWQKSLLGRTLSEIKSDDAEIDRFAKAAADLISQMLGPLNDSWCLVTTPKRRHKQRNFATLVCLSVAQKLGVKFYEDCASCHEHERVNAVFSLNIAPTEPNIIVFDDIVTTGSTFAAMARALEPLKKSTFFFAGINNKF